MKRLTHSLIAAIVFFAACDAWAVTKFFTQTTAPATCTTGDMWIDTNGTSGNRIYSCEATNTWTLQDNRHWVAQTTAPADTTLLWFDTDQNAGEVVLKIYTGGAWVSHSAGSGADTLAALSCNAGEVAKWNGSAWACAADSTGSGSVPNGATAGDTLTWSGTEWVANGDKIILYGGGGYWTSLQAGASVANRAWRLPIDAPPSAGTTRIMNMDQYGQMGFVDPATFASALGTDDNYVTDAEKTKLSNLSGTNTGDQTASGVNITDAGNYFVATTVEAALQELGNVLAAMPNLAAGTGITITEDGGGAGIDTINVTPNTYQAYDANMISWPSSISATEVGYLDGLTGSISSSLAGKQDSLSSGTNIKTVNGSSLLGSGNISISGTFSFDTFPTYEDSAHNSGIAVNGTTLAVYSTTAGKWLTVGLTDSLDPSPSAPTLTSRTIGTDGTSLTLGASASLSIGAGGSGGFDVDCVSSGNNISATYASGAPGSSIVYTLGATVASGDTCDLDYTQPGNGLEATSGGVDLASISSGSITNNSSQSSVSYDITETFAAAGYDLTWTESSGNPDPDYTGDGGQKLLMDSITPSTGQSTYTGTTDATTQYQVTRIKIKITTLPTFNDVYPLVITSRGGADVAQFGINRSGGISYFYSRPFQGDYTTTTASVSTGTEYYVWCVSKKGTGSGDAFSSVAFSTTSTRPTTGSYFASTTSGNGTDAVTRVALNAPYAGSGASQGITYVVSEVVTWRE